MSNSKNLGSVWTVAIALAMVSSSPPGLTPTQDDPSRKTQQDQDKQKKKDKSSTDSNPPPNGSKSDDTRNGDKPAPLFGGTLNVKSSRQTKDSATLGFNGVDDNGQVQKSFLQATATGADTSAVQKLAGTQLNSADLDEFIQQGGLSSAAAPRKSSSTGAKP